MTIRLLVLIQMCVFAFVFPAAADQFRVGDLEVGDPWARATPNMARTGAVYLMISNHGTERDMLVAVTTPVAKKAALHTHLMANNVMKMRHVEGVEVHPGEPAVFRPGGLHVMLIGLRKPLKEGDVFPMILTFRTAGQVEVRVEVQKIGAMRPAGRGHDRDTHKRGS